MKMTVFNFNFFCFTQKIFYLSGCYFTLSQQLPHLQKLKNLLEMNLYLGKAIDDNSNETKKVIITARILSFFLNQLVNFLFKKKTLV